MQKTLKSVFETVKGITMITCQFLTVMADVEIFAGKSQYDGLCNKKIQRVDRIMNTKISNNTEETDQSMSRWS